MTGETETETDRRRTVLSPAARAAVAAQLTGRTNRLFYCVVLLVALVGSSTAARSWLLGDPADGAPAPWWFLPLALVAVAVYELGAVVVSRFADHRRQLGERAGVARLASAALAGGAIAAQYLGHTQTGQAIFFAGVSATGYVIYLLEAGANRRDALRRDSKLADTPPAYGWSQWIRHFWITRRARALALANAEARLQDRTLPTLGRVASLAAAADQVRAERRLAAIEDALRARIAAGVDKTMAKIAVNTYDMARVATGIAAAADYPALTRIITAELVPARLVKLGPAGAQQGPAGDRRAADAAAAAITEHVAELVAGPAGETAPTRPAPPAETETVRPEPAETETAPAETETETDEPPAETAPRRRTLEPVPPSLTSIIGNGHRPPPAAPVPPPAPPETGPVPTADVSVPLPAETETAPPPPAPPTGPDQGETDETGTETEADPLAGVAPKLFPYLLKVIDTHRDWAVAVMMPPRHPDALNVPRILTTVGMKGKQLGVDICDQLKKLSADPETAERAVRSRCLAAAASN